MTVSATANTGYSDPNQMIPVFSSENARSAAEDSNPPQKSLTMFQDGDDSPSFWDLLDIINPLQHIPVVNSLYQELTGDKIGVGARLAGDTLFGGAIGLVASVVNCLVEENTGDDIGGHVLALFKDGGDSTTTLAQAPTETGSAKSAAAPAAPPASVADANGTSTATAQAVELPEADSALVATLRATQPMSFGTDPLGTAPTTPLGTTPSTAQPTLLAAADGVVQPALAAAQVPTHAAPARGQAKTAGDRTWAPPARTGIESAKAPPPITVPISTSGARSNVPPTGRAPTAAYAATKPDPLALERAMAQQGLGGVKHPMLPDTGTETTGATTENDAGSTATTPTLTSPAASAAAASVSGADWMQAMNQALDKYQKAGNLAASRADATTAPY